jgi:predicted Zn-dependent protease
MRSSLVIVGLILVSGLAMSLRWAAAEAAPDCEGLEGTKRQTKDLALTDELLKRRPDDVFLHLSYQQSAYPSTVAERGKVIERYKQLADSHPGSLEYAYLYAAALVGTHTPEAISRLKQILSANPKYPLAHLELARTYQGATLSTTQRWTRS